LRGGQHRSKVKGALFSFRFTQERALPPAAAGVPYLPNSFALIRFHRPHLASAVRFSRAGDGHAPGLPCPDGAQAFPTPGRAKGANRAGGVADSHSDCAMVIRTQNGKPRPVAGLSTDKGEDARLARAFARKERLWRGSCYLGGAKEGVILSISQSRTPAGAVLEGGRWELEEWLAPAARREICLFGSAFQVGPQGKGTLEGGKGKNQRIQLSSRKKSLR